MSGILSQWDNDTHHHFVTFFSWKLQPAECNYSMLNQELLVIVTSFKAWQHYLKGSKHLIKVITDHHNLCYFLRVKSLTQRQTHWAEFLFEFDFSIEYWADVKNSADALSWRADYQSEGLDVYILVPSFKLIILSLCTEKVDLGDSTSLTQWPKINHQLHMIRHTYMHHKLHSILHHLSPHKPQ